MTNGTLKEQIGHRIRTERKAKKLTQTKLGELAGNFSQSRVNNWEKGIRTPGIEEAKQLAVILDVSPSYLLCLSDRKKDIEFEDIMTIDIDCKTIVGCIPVSRLAQAPTDQSPCIKEKCPLCEKDMWVSEKKRAMRDKSPQNVEIYCFLCLVAQFVKQGINPSDIELADMSNFN